MCIRDRCSPGAAVDSAPGVVGQFGVNRFLRCPSGVWAHSLVSSAEKLEGVVGTLLPTLCVGASKDENNI